MNQSSISELSELIVESAIAQSDPLMGLGDVFAEPDMPHISDLMAAFAYDQASLNLPKKFPQNLKNRLFQRLQQEREVRVERLRPLLESGRLHLAALHLHAHASQPSVRQHELCPAEAVGVLEQE